MVTLIDDIIEYFKIYPFAIDVLDVRNTYVSKDPVYPMIVVEETRNTTKQALHHVEVFSTLNYRFDIYAQDSMIDDEVVSASRIVDMIAQQLDEQMKSYFGMQRVGDPIKMNYDNSNSKFRKILTYGGIIDTKTMIVYQ